MCPPLPFTSFGNVGVTLLDHEVEVTRGGATTQMEVILALLDFSLIKKETPLI